MEAKKGEEVLPFLCLNPAFHAEIGKFSFLEVV